MAGPGNCNPAYSFSDSIFLYIMHPLKRIVNPGFSGMSEASMFEKPVKPKRKPDFIKNSWGFWIEEGVTATSNKVEHIAICPRSGELMFMEDEAYDMWQYMDREFNKAYQKWAKKQAEKLLLGQ